MDIIEKINKENELLYGPRQSCCDLYEHFCRCNYVSKQKPIIMVNDILDQRTLLVQDVIDRHVKYGETYFNDLNLFNSKFELDVKTIRGVRIYKN
jgi:hypothetical protein